MNTKAIIYVHKLDDQGDSGAPLGCVHFDSTKNWCWEDFITGDRKERLYNHDVALTQLLRHLGLQ